MERDQLPSPFHGNGSEKNWRYLAVRMCLLLSLTWTYYELLPAAFELIPMHMEICGVLV